MSARYIYKNRKAQVLAVGLWVLILIALLAISISHRVSMALRISGYQKNKFKAFYLAKAGLNYAISEIEKDANAYDALDELWADNEETFKDIRLGAGQPESASVSYQVLDADNNPETVYGVVDEERKININTANFNTLLALLEKYQIEGAVEKVNNILIWRGDNPDANKIYESLGYPAKADKFSNIQELALVKDVTFEDCQKVKELITVYGDGMININTVPEEALTILARGIAKDKSYAETFADSVAEKIIGLRNKNGHFTQKDEISVAITGDEELNIFNSLTAKTGVSSCNFLIKAAGAAGKAKAGISAVYNRKEKNILSLYEGS